MSDQTQTLTPPEAPEQPSPDRLGKVCFFGGMMVLVFLMGGLMAFTNRTFAWFLGSAVDAYRAATLHDELIGEKFPPFLWFPEPGHERGLLKCDPEKSYPGYTLYLSGEGGTAALLDQAGNEAYRWDLPFNKAWPNPPQLPRRAPDSFFLIRRAHVFPNGDLLALYTSPVYTPHGCGMAKFDKDGNTLWTFDANTHHDFDIAPDGTIYVLVLDICEESLGENWEFVRPPFQGEFLSILSPDGKERKRISLFDWLGKSKFHRMVTTSSSSDGDVMHSNTVHIVGKEFASHYDEISPGDLMICYRNLNLVTVVNLARDEIVWATTGPWCFPHDPDPLPNGNIMIFDNCFYRGSFEGSRVLEFTPDRTGHIVWQYSGTDDAPLRSTVRSVQQLLPNDNVLIAESDRGRIVEVTRSGEVVWEYVLLPKGGPDGKLIPIVCGARRYSAEELPFLTKSKTPKVASTAR